MYETACHIAIASAYVCDIYANAIDKLSSIFFYKDTILHLCGTLKNILFDAVKSKRRYHKNSFALGVFLSYRLLFDLMYLL